MARYTKMLLESQDNTIDLRGEYWWDGSELLYADEAGDYTHEGLVMREVINICCDALGIENTYDTDALWFRSDLLDDSETSDTWKGDVKATLLAQNLSPEYADQVISIVSGGMDDTDLRDFAMKFWGWIRIANHFAELPDLTPQSLKQLYEAVCEAYFEEHDEQPPEDAVMCVNQGRARKQWYVTLDELYKGRLSRNEADTDKLSAAATAQVRNMDIVAQPSFYGGNLGD